MIKLNLRKGRPPIHLQRFRNWTAAALLILLFWQMGTFIQNRTAMQIRQTEINALKAQLQTLQARREALTVLETLEALNGAVNARNKWVQDREKSPLAVLAKLEQEQPGAVEIQSFEAEGNRGTIRLLAGDMDIVQRYMHAVFGHTNVRITMEERFHTGIIAACTWTE
jgi:Tfp pilus assembly protein PilN